MIIYNNNYFTSKYFSVRIDVMGVTPTTSKMPMINVIIEKRNTMLKLDFPAVLIGMISFVLLSCKKTKIADTKITNGNNEYNISGVFNNAIIRGNKIFE